MTICNISGVACDCQPDEGIPRTATLENMVASMHGWRTECFNLRRQLRQLRAEVEGLATANYERVVVVSLCAVLDLIDKMGGKV